MRVLVAMSGGVDSSVAAALLIEEGNDVVGATMKLWGGPSDSGCCSVADVEDARRVAQQLGIVHHVFNFTDDFDAHVVGPYVDAHAQGLTPNPCVECNRHLKFDRFLRRAEQLGFDAIATGHHARVEWRGDRWALVRGADARKDQSYVLSMLDQATLARVVLPIGGMTKAEVRDHASRLGLRTATKPDSQDVCFISRTDGGRHAFLGDRIPLRPGRVVTTDGRTLGEVAAVELVTVGQRRGLPHGGERLYAVDVDIAAASVTVGPERDLLVDVVELTAVTWTDSEPVVGERLVLQPSAHGHLSDATWLGDGRVAVEPAIRRVAPGQTVVLYRGDEVAGAGLAI